MVKAAHVRGGHKEKEELQITSLLSALEGNSLLMSLLGSRLGGVKSVLPQTCCEPAAPSCLGDMAGE